MRDELRRLDDDPASATSLAGAARYLLTVPGQLADLVGARLIRNVNLDMLLEPYVASHKGRQLGVSALGRVVHAGPTKTL